MKKHLLFNQSFGTEGSPNQTGETQTRENRIGLMSYLHRILMLLLVAYIGIGNAWGASYTWSFDNSGGSKVDLSSKSTNFTSTTGSKTLSYTGGSSDAQPAKSNYLKVNGASSQSSNALGTRYFTLTAPSANGTISIKYGSTVNGAALIHSANGVYHVVNAVASSTTISPLIWGLTAGTTVIHIGFTGQEFIESITWTDADAPEALTTLYSSDYKSSMESGASISVSSSGMGEQTGGSGWVSAYSKYYKATSTSREATITFSPALSLVSDGNDRGKIRIYYGSSGHSLNTTVISDFKINGGSSIGTAYGVIEKEKVHVIEYTIPVGTSTLTTIYNKIAVSNGCLLHVEVLTHSAGGGDVTAPTLLSSIPANDATNVATSGNITLTFSENVTINDASKFSLTGGAGTLSTGSASASGAVVTIPYSGLANNTTYTLATAEGAVKDASNNTSAALSDITFTTVKASHTVTAESNNDSYGTVSAGSSSVAEGSTTTITATPATGYQVTNWAVSGTGASISPSGASNSNTTTLTMGTANATVTATFGPKSYTVTLNNQEADDAGTESVTTTYNSNTNLTSAITKPTKDGKVFAGYFTAANGGGVQLIDPAGNWIASAGGGSTYLDGSKNWKNDGNLTLYACWMEYASTFDIQAWVQSNIDDTKTSTTYTILGTNKLIYSLGGSSALDNSNKSSYEGLKMKNSGDYVMFLVQANSALKLYFGYTGTDPKKSINGGAEANMDVSSIGSETANQEVDLGTQTYDRLVKVRTVNGNSVVLQKIEITAACTAADHVDISGEWAAFIGYPISLTATAYDDEDNAIETGLSYQWYKDGTADGNMIDGATSATYYKASAVEGDYGSYYCKVSKAGCSDVFSSAFGIKIMRIHLMWENGTEVFDYAFHNFAPIGGSKAVCTIALEGYNYSLQVLDGQYGWGDHNNAWFGRSNYWGTTDNPWAHDVVNNKTYLNCDIAGDYVFTLDYSNGYKLGVMYPQPTYYYKGNDDAWSSTHEMTKSCDGTYAYFWTKGATSLQAAGRNTNNNNFLIMNAAGSSTIADGNKLEIRNGEATGFGGTDIWGSSNMGKWDGSSSNASIYNAGDFYIVVFYPNNSINTTNDPKICASTKLPGNATTADEVVYFEKPASNWGDKAYYRIGHRGTSSAPEMELVPGTARLYQHVLSEWTGYEAWSIANNSSWQGSNNSIYQVNTGDTYAVTKSTNYFKCETDGNITIILDDANNTADGCTYYNVNTYSGMLTHTATVSDMTNGSVRLNWKDVNDAAQSATSTTSNLAHTCNLQITGVPATGYDVATLTVNGSNFTSGDTHVLSADATIAATFSLHNYNVTYSAPGNGNNYTIKVADGSATSTSKTATMGQTITIVASPAAGYDFTGWTITKAGGAGTVTPADASATTTTFTMPTSDVTITASFTLKTYTITAAVNNGDYGSVSPASITVDHGSTISISDNVLTCDGNTLTATATTSTAQYTYAFDNWTGVTHGATVTSNLTATANFTRTANSYTLTWNLAGGTVTTAGTGAAKDATGSPSSSVAFGTAITVPVVAKSGYTFAGWDVSPAGTMPAANTTYTATWTPVAATHTVTYDAQGGSVTPTSETVSTATLPTPTKSGYTFQGWYTSGGTKAGNGGATYEPEADITLYALWRADCAGGGGGGGTLFSQNFNSATEVAYENRKDASLLINKNSSNNIVGTTAASQFTSIAAAKKDKTGIAINTTSGGNSVNASGFFQTYYDNTSGYWSVTKTTDFATTAPTAIKMSMDLYFDTKSSSGSCELVNFAIGDGFSDGLMSTSAQSSSNVHSGWGIAQNSKKICGYTDNGTILYNTALSESTWYSITWVINNTGEDLTYDDPDGSGTTTLANDKFDIWLKTQAQTATNYTKVVTAAATTTSKALQELYFGHISGKKNEFRIDNIVVADLTPSSGTCYYVTYNGNGATGGFTKDETAYALNADPTVASNSFTKTGYTFTGWNTLANGTGDPYAAGGTISDISADVTLYAQWAADAATYELTWNTNGGSDLVCSGTCTSGDLAYGATIVAPTDPTKSNYTFDGWNTADDGSGSGKASTMPASDVTYYAAWKQTVTLKTGLQGSDGDKTPYIYWNGTALSDDAVHSAAGYTLNGYYTESTGGTKVLNADGTFAASAVTDYITSSKWSRTGAAPTLYAQWRAAAGKTCYTWDASETHPQTGTTNYDGLYLTATTKVKYQANSALTDTIYDVSNNGKSLTGHINGAVIDSLIFGASTSSSGNTTFVVSFCSTQTFDTAKIIKVGGYHCTVYNVALNTAAASLTKIKAPAGTKSFVLSRNYMSDKLTSSASLSNSGSRYLYYVRACSASGGTHTISYNAGGGTGTMSSNTGITDDGSQPLTTNSFTAPTNYSFAGWVADGAVTIGGDVKPAGTLIADGATITNITMDIALTAKWSQSVTLDANTSNHGSTGGSATAVWNATGLTGITHATPASGYKLLGYYTAETEGTKVLNSDGTFAGDDITGWISDGKWTCVASTRTLYAQYEASGSLKWNLGVNTEATSLTTSSKESSFTQIAVANMGDATLSGSTYAKSAKSSLTGKISSPATKSDYVYVTFKVAAGYKFTPSNISVKVQPVGENEHKAVELSLADATNTLASSSATKCNGTSSGTTTTVTLAGNGTYFTGTVTLKIYVYAHATATATNYNCYRLGTPITIEGAVEATCVMPSFTGLDYDQTSYTVDEPASAISVTGAANEDSYQWKYNTVNDRTSGTGCGTGASVTPSTASTGTLYYWCELTNTCGTVKTPAVGITVSATKSDATISWTGTSASANYGGGGYTVKATVNEIGWNGNAEDLTLSAPAGIRIYNIESGTTDSKKYVQASFDVTTAFDRETYSTTIPFVVTADATTTYNAISDEEDVTFDACTGGGGSSEEWLMPVNTDSLQTYNWRFLGKGKMWYGYGSSSLNSSNVKSLATNMEGGAVTKYYKGSGSIFCFYTEHAITGVRLYVYTSNSDITVSNVYISNSAFTSSTPSSGAVTFEAVYNDDNDGLDKGTDCSAWTEITFDSEVAAGKYGFIKLSGNVNIAGIALISGSSSGATLNTHLQWSGDLENNGTVNKKTTDAYFTYSASMITENTNSLGAITYSSSDPSVATVDATGKVAMVAAGTTTIKATLAASGCYKKAEISYTLNVTEEECAIAAGTLTLTSGSESKCSSDNVTLTLTGFESDASIQWKDGDTNINNGGNYEIETDGTTSTLTTDQPGTYSVIVTNGCVVRSNRITITNKSTTVHVTRLVKEWYIKNGRLTPDIALWELGDDCSFVGVTASSGWDAGTDLTEAELGEKVFYEKDGIVYMKGTEPKANAGAVQNYTLTLTVNDGCGNQTLNAEGKEITIHHQQNTDKHVLAFVVNGTDKGDWTAGVTADQTTNVGLYNAIAAQFDVQATNIYSTDDEQKLREYYSQYDILCITDYPNTKTKGVNSKSYVDAIGALIDIRPILTMEAYVSSLANWRAKGISGNPKSPTTRQYTMDLQCKDHEIFASTDLTKVGEGDEAMYRVSMVDNTKEDYATLDATYGDGAHADKSGYEYASKPALQGFTFTEEMANDLLPIGLIGDGAGNPLQVGIERQHNMEARLMVLGINSYAMERLTDDGERVVINALNYLMKKNAEDIADCSTSFVGGAEGEEKNWNNADNWTGNTVPLPSQKVRILAECEVSSTVHALDVLIVTDGKYNHGSDNAAGKLTIKENGALIVGGKIQAASAPAYNRPRATTPDRLLIETSSTNQAALIFDNEEAETQATVKLYSLGRKDGNYQYQYFAVPMEVVPVNPTFANETHGGTGIYTYVYSEATSGWTRRKYYDDLFAFEGLGITTKSTGAMEYTMTGNLASTATKEITLTHDGAGLNLVGNSWMAPIQIGALAEDNTDANITKTVYIYCAGRDAEEGAATSGVTETAGQWIAIPFEAAEFETWKAAGKLSVIPAMQAFQIKVSAEATLTLDYDKVVRGSTNDLNAKLRAPGRRMAANEVTMTNIRVADSKTYTDLSLFEGDRFSEAFDNGWEAEYMNGDGRSAKLYAETEAGQMAVAAMYDYEGTVVGFAPGQETEYTFSFMGEDNGYYLNDIKLQNSVRISEGETYTFTYEEGDAANRFYISRTAINAPEVATGMENLDAAAPKVQKIIYNDKLYIIRGGRLYDATGKVVK